MTDRKQHIARILESLELVRRKLLQPAAGDWRQLTRAQWPVVAHVMRRGGATVKELAAALQVSSSAVSQQVDVLVDKGYLMRDGDAADGRATMVRLSRRQKRRLGWIEDDVVARAEQVFASFTKAELVELDRLQLKLAAALLEET